MKLYNRERLPKDLFNRDIDIKFFFKFSPQLLVVAPITRGYQLDTSYARFPSFNDLPQPEGSWQENHDRKQQKYNAALGASIIGLVLTIAYVSILF